MSKRNPGKKPISKATTSIIEQQKRKQGVRDLKKRFLIVCEDAKSAPNYFLALRRHFKLSATSVRVVGSDGNSQPIQVVNRAIQIKNQVEKANKPKKQQDAESYIIKYDEVWCVIDGDYGNKITNARASAKANQVQLAVSTMCFEYWILLHFEENDTSTSNCDAIVSSLKAKKYIPKYAKGTCDFHDVVPHVHAACKRAKKLRRPAENPEEQNPCSEVYKLINAILPSAPSESA